MQLKKGSFVLPFKAIDINGGAFDIETLKGHPVLLSFFRDTTCIFCNLRVHQMIKWLETNKTHRLRVIALYTSSEEEIKNYTRKLNPPFIIIHDPDLKIYHQYGLQSSLKGKLIALLRFKKIIQSAKAGVFSLRSLPRRNTLPADFLIGPDQKVNAAYYGKDFGDHIPIKDIEDWLEGL